MRAGDWPLTVGDRDLTETFFLLFEKIFPLLENATHYSTMCQHVIKNCQRALCNVSIYLQYVRMCIFGF